MDEFVFVTYPTRRSVTIDGHPNAGFTDDLLMVPTGLHTFALGGDQDYEPKPDPILIQRTTANNPAVIAFEPLPAAEADEEPGDSQ